MLLCFRDLDYLMFHIIMRIVMDGLRRLFVGCLEQIVDFAPFLIEPGLDSLHLMHVLSWSAVFELLGYSFRGLLFLLMMVDVKGHPTALLLSSAFPNGTLVLSRTYSGFGEQSIAL